MNEFYESPKENYIKPVSIVYELSLESTILQTSSEGSGTDPGDDGKGNITLFEFRCRNF